MRVLVKVVSHWAWLHWLGCVVDTLVEKSFQKSLETWDVIFLWRGFSSASVRWLGSPAIWDYPNPFHHLRSTKPPGDPMELQSRQRRALPAHECSGRQSLKASTLTLGGSPDFLPTASPRLQFLFLSSCESVNYTPQPLTCSSRTANSGQKRPWVRGSCLWISTSLILAQ